MTLRVAIVQARPAYLDLDAGLALVEARTREAASQGAKLVAFGETFLPGYPVWLDTCPAAALWDHEPTKRLHARLHAESLVIPGPATERLGACAREHGVVLVIGAQERVERGPGTGTLYNTLLIFDADGSLVRHHRKLMPTFTEKLVWGLGDGCDLGAVPTAAGRVGGLICWEHWMPLARQTQHDSGEQIHIALWPTVHDRHHLASRHYAFEGRTFVLAVGSILAASELPEELEPTPELAADPSQLVMRGGSAVYGPDGSTLVEPVFDDEAILYSDLDVEQIARESMTLDSSGHYARPDVFTYDVHRRRPT